MADGRCSGRRGRLTATAAATALRLFALVAFIAAAAGAAPQLRMAQPTLMLPSLGNASDGGSGDVLVAVRLVGKAAKTVTARLSLLLPPANDTAAGGAVNSSAWVAPDPDELWLEPATVSWLSGEPAGAKHVRLQSAAELPLSVVLEDSLYLGDGGGSGSGATQRPMLRVQLVDASGAAIDAQRSSTVLMLGGEGQDGAPGGPLAAGAADPPLFGFIANQAAYPPANRSSSNPVSIPVRLLAGQLQAMATLKFVVRLLGSSAARNRGSQQFMPSKALSGFLYFKPAANGSGVAMQGSSAEVQQQLVELPLVWGRIPPEAEYRLGLELQPVYNAAVQPQPEAVALHVFGTQLGTCPPGTAVKQDSDSRQGSGGVDSPVSSNDGSFAEEADFGLLLNGTVIDLSSHLLEAGVREYAAMVDSKVPSVTLCLRSGSQGSGLVQKVPSAGAALSAAPLRPAAADVAIDACGCDDGSLGDGSGGASVKEDSLGDGSCAYTAWRLPLQAGQNQFTVTLPGNQSLGVSAPMIERSMASAQSSSAEVAGSSADDSSTEQYSLAVVRLADPEHAELESITGKLTAARCVKSSDDTAVLLCGPSNSSGNSSSSSKKLPSRTALDTGDAGGVLLPVAVQACQPGKLLMLNVSEQSRLISLTPALKAPNVPGIRVEVNGQVLSRGGDVAADQLEDTTAMQQQRTNASFLPSAFILGLLPGSHLNAEVVVVAEDGVTTLRYPIQFAVVAGSSRKQQLAVAEASASSGNMATGDGSTVMATGPSVRRQGWPLAPALQPTCTVCPGGWAAGAANSSACHMCPPGTYSPAEQSLACLSCGPGTFAYSWGSSYCKNCIEGTYAPAANSSLCLPCPANTTTREDGQSACDVPLLPGAYQAPRYAVVVSFWVTLTGVDPQDVVVRAGVNAAPEAIVTSLIRADTAHQFNISIDDVQVISVHQVARRTLSANVTATLGVDVPAGATEEDIAAALEVERLSADEPIDMLSSDPDRFFGRTTKAGGAPGCAASLALGGLSRPRLPAVAAGTLEVEVDSAVQGTTESKPGGTNMGLLWGLLGPGILAILVGVGLVVMGCRRSPACVSWRGAAARRLGTSRVAPRALAYSRYSGSSTGGSTA